MKPGCLVSRPRLLQSTGVYACQRDRKHRIPGILCASDLGHSTASVLCEPEVNKQLFSRRDLVAKSFMLPLAVVSTAQSLLEPEEAGAAKSAGRIGRKHASGYLNRKTHKGARLLANVRTRDSMFSGAPSVLASIVQSAYGSSWHAPPLVTLLGLGLVNAAGLWVVLQGLRKLQDGAEPVSLVRVQVALMSDGHDNLQHRLSELYSMIQLGQRGLWLILEETAVEVLKYQSSCKYASVVVEQVDSKTKAEETFSAWAKQDSWQANTESQFGHEHQDETVKGGLLAKMFKSQPKSEVMIVTLVVAALGDLDIPETCSSWQDLRHTLQQLSGLTSDRLKAVELVWTPNKEGQYLTEEQLVQDYPDMTLLAHRTPKPATQ